EEFAAGVVRVVNANMEKALRVVSIERGHDPRQFALVAFGGAGAMHACELAQSLRIPRVIVPVYPGALSALGILISDVVKDHSRTVLLRASEATQKRLQAIYSELQQEISAELKKEEWKGRAIWEPSADLRYRGQGYEINLHYGWDMVERFHVEHKRRYGYSSREREVEIVTLRIRGKIASPEKLTGMKVEKHPALQTSEARVWFGGKQVRTSILPRADLARGKRYRGPAIITEYSATTVVPPGLFFQADKAGNLLVEVP
ncbi:MAG TPA: hydantoinase/oxoprolinase family protein, partial [Candidatus Angelobacter sp.]|nr:hydantoinase/oxoprolinase family protein [Candidatus Angelobacter sp.]